MFSGKGQYGSSSTKKVKTEGLNVDGITLGFDHAR
jgi:hypothetical protein